MTPRQYEDAFGTTYRKPGLLARYASGTVPQEASRKVRKQERKAARQLAGLNPVVAQGR